jgi:hypothetical protein
MTSSASPNRIRNDRETSPTVETGAYRQFPAAASTGLEGLETIGRRPFTDVAIDNHVMNITAGRTNASHGVSGVDRDPNHRRPSAKQLTFQTCSL